MAFSPQHAKVLGTVPLLFPTPELSKMITGRLAARELISDGSQKSMLPR